MATDLKLKPGERVAITGWPKTGKTTLAAHLGGGRSTDELIEILEAERFPKAKRWSETSLRVSKWFDAPGPWMIEGVAIPRALRKWKENNPRKAPPIDRLIILKEPHQKLTSGQTTMGKGLDTVLAEILPWLRKHVEVVEIAGADLPKPAAEKKATRKKGSKVSDTAADVQAVMDGAKTDPKPKAKPKAKKEPKPKQNRERKPKPARPTRQEELIINERQELVYQLYRNGATIRQISRILEDRGFSGASKSNIQRDLTTAIEEGSLRRDLSKEQMLDVLIETTRDIIGAFASKAFKEKDVQAGALIRTCINDLDKFMNVSKGRRADTDAKTALAKLLGLDPEELPSEREDDAE